MATRKGCRSATAADLFRLRTRVLPAPIALLEVRRGQPERAVAVALQQLEDIVPFSTQHLVVHQRLNREQLVGALGHGSRAADDAVPAIDEDPEQPVGLAVAAVELRPPPGAEGLVLLGCLG